MKSSRIINKPQQRYIAGTMHDYTWLCLTMHYYAWLFMTMLDYAWLCMTMHDYAWLCMIIYCFIPSAFEWRRSWKDLFGNLLTSDEAYFYLYFQWTMAHLIYLICILSGPWANKGKLMDRNEPWDKQSNPIQTALYILYLLDFNCWSACIF